MSISSDFFFFLGAMSLGRRWWILGRRKGMVIFVTSHHIYHIIFISCHVTSIGQLHLDISRCWECCTSVAAYNKYTTKRSNWVELRLRPARGSRPTLRICRKHVFVKRRFQPTQRKEHKELNEMTSLLDRPITAANDDGVCRWHTTKLWQTRALKLNLIRIISCTTSKKAY